MKAVIDVEIKRFIRCPECGDNRSHNVTHIIKDNTRSFGPWYCDTCGLGINGTHNCGLIEIEPSNLRKRVQYSLLKLSGGDDPEIFVLVEGMYFEDVRNPLCGKALEADLEKNKKYFYEEHNCPTNITQHVVKVITKTEKSLLDDDDHGLFEYMKSFLVDKKLEDLTLDEFYDETIKPLLEEPLG